MSGRRRGPVVALFIVRKYPPLLHSFQKRGELRYNPYSFLERNSFHLLTFKIRLSGNVGNDCILAIRLDPFSALAVTDDGQP